MKTVTFLSLLLLNSVLGTQARGLDAAPSSAHESILGVYELYIADNYQKTTVLLRDGTLFLHPEGEDEIEIKVLDADNLAFHFEDKGRDLGITFHAEDGEAADGYVLSIPPDAEYQATRLYENRPPRTSFTKDEILEDLAQIERVAGMHPIPFAFTSESEFQALHESAMENAHDGMTIPEFYRIAPPLIAAIGCGHSRMVAPRGYWSSVGERLFPLQLQYIDDRAYLLEDLSASGLIPAGSEVVSVDGHSATEIRDGLYMYISADAHLGNYKRLSLAGMIPLLYPVVYGMPDGFDVTHRLPGEPTETTRVMISPISFAEMRAAASGDDGNGLEFEVLADDDAAVIRIATFDFYSDSAKGEFREFIDQSFADVSERNVSNVILDLRGNLGGDPFAAIHLLSYMAPDPVPYFKDPDPFFAETAKPIELAANNRFGGQLYVLIDGLCLSTTGHLLSLMKYHGIGVMIGEETGSTYTCNDGKTRVTLKNTRFRIYMAREQFATAVEGMRSDRGIIPDHPVKRNATDIARDHDTVLRYTLDLMAE